LRWRCKIITVAKPQIFDFNCYQLGGYISPLKNKVVVLERGPLSLVSATEELLGSNSSGSGLESREYGLGIRHADHVAPSTREELALTSLTSGGRSVGIVRLRTEAMELLLLLLLLLFYFVQNIKCSM
jgi:hypothetical protein